MPAATKMKAIQVERLLSRIPKAVRRSLPNILSEHEPGSKYARPTIEAGVVYLAHVGHRLDDRGGWEAAGKLAELTPYYAQGWKFAYAEPVDGGQGVDVYLWRSVK